MNSKVKVRVPGPASLLKIVAVLLAAPVNKYGKPEFFSVEEVAAREKIRELAVHFDTAPSDTVLHQAAKVIEAVLHEY